MIMKVLKFVFIMMAVGGLWGHLGVTLLCLPMLALMRHAERVFAEQDAEYARNNPPTPAPTEDLLGFSSCNAL